MALGFGRVDQNENAATIMVTPGRAVRSDEAKDRVEGWEHRIRKEKTTPMSDTKAQRL